MKSSPNRLLATIFGAVYLLVGLIGFFVTSGVGFVSTQGGLLRRYNSKGRYRRPRPA